MAVFRNSTFLIIILFYLKVHNCLSKALSFDKSQLDTCQKYNIHLDHKYTDFFVVNKNSNRITPDETLHLKFYVMASKDAHILLSAYPNNLNKDYEIVIGGYNNTRSEIRLKYDYHSVINISNIVSETDITLFEIIQKKDGWLYVYTPSYSDEPFLKYFDPEPIEINYVSFTGFKNATGKWFYSCGFDNLGSQILGKCTNLKNCTCDEGYSPSNSTNNKCVPVCEEGCRNGDCVAPNKCVCNEGYYKTIENICKPVCKEDCSNGVCIAPNICTCNEGYFRSNSNNNKCKPVCEEGCLNGYCVAPNKCVCFSGYYETIENMCEPLCEEGCLNGDCVAPNNCTCYEGYSTSKSNNNKCEPVCEEGCRNGDCVAPNKCVCYSGYYKTIENICEPLGLQMWPQLIENITSLIVKKLPSITFKFNEH